MADQHFEPTTICPSGEGGVGFVFRAGDRYASIEIDNEGESIAVTRLGKTEPRVWPAGFTLDEAKLAVSSMKEFLSNGTGAAALADAICAVHPDYETASEAQSHIPPE